MKYFYLFLFFFIFIKLNAQQGFVFAGGDVSNISGSISSSMGQVASATINNKTHIITQGIQQTYLTMSGINNFKPDLTINLFPNPGNEFLYLQSDDPQRNEFQYSLYDIYGQLLNTKLKISNNNEIDISRLVNGVYTLNIRFKNELVKTIKFIKI
ncbi:MAG: T9SS type A sorting domain-containing protein [Saprospiraceae bacterium]|nr:T9SS type A sorting domain-containing protein [Saprospiraceae bacterium]